MLVEALLVATIAVCSQVEPPAPAPPPETVLHCGTLLAVPGAPPRREASVVIRDGAIVEILDGYATRLGATTIDLRDAFVLPGLIDCHVHITGQYSADVRLRLVTESDADRAIHGVVYAKKTLLAGFTTVRDVGSIGDAAFAVRDAIEQGLVAGPRILVAGEAITPTGGHGDTTLGYRDDLFDIPGPMDGVADGADACRQAVRAQIKRGADVIKCTATGGVLSNTEAGLEQQLFDDELAAIVATAHQLGRRVAAHAHGASGVRAALKAGVDSIEHGTFLDDECIALFKSTKAFLVPTVHAGKFVARAAESAGYFPPPVRHKATLVGDQIQRAVARAHRAGVRIAFGTDVGVGAHGTNALEFGFLVEAGLTPTEAIVAATVNAAELCGLSKEIGTIEPGKRADIIAVTGDPLADVSKLQKMRFVMSKGVVAAP